MRLHQSEIDLLKSTLTLLSKEAKLYLFGSRVDDTKKGGDIDLLVVSKKLKKKDLRILRIEFFKIFGEQKIDVLLDNGEFSNIFHQLIFKKAVLL